MYAVIRTGGKQYLVSPGETLKIERTEHKDGAIEFSDASIRALEYALSLAEETDARLILLHVIEGADEPSLAEMGHLSIRAYYRYLEEDAMALIPA